MLINAKEMTKKAFKEGYAVPAININNLEWTKVILQTAEELKSPMIVAVSEGALKYMGGFNVVKGMVQGMVKDLNITVPIALHLDHGTYEGSKKAIEVGFTSIMYDGSSEDWETNYNNSKEIIELARDKDISVEVEVGSIGGEEDGVIGTGEIADPEQVKAMAELGADMIAAGINNIHGKYPEGWEGLNFDILKELIKFNTPLVMHGGSGVPTEQTIKAIELGISKINVNTELQLANAAAIKEFVTSGKIDEGKNYDPRKILKSGHDAMADVIRTKINEFGSANKA